MRQGRAFGRYVDRLRLHLGVKGRLLVLVGAAWVLMAVNIHTGASDLVTDPDPALFHLTLPLGVREALWAVSGLVAVGGALVMSPRFEGLGFAAAFIPPAQRALSYGGSWLVSVVTERGVPGAWAPALGWAVCAIAILAVAKIREATPLPDEDRGSVG